MRSRTPALLPNNDAAFAAAAKEWDELRKGAVHSLESMIYSLDQNGHLLMVKPSDLYPLVAAVELLNSGQMRRPK